MRKTKKISIKNMKWLDFGTFPGGFLFISGYSFDEAKALMISRKYDKEWLATFDATDDLWGPGTWGFACKRTIDYFKTKSEKHFFFLVIKRDFDFSDWHMIALAHECTHLSTYYLTGVLDIIKENEAFAYTHSYIMKKILEILRNGTITGL